MNNISIKSVILGMGIGVFLSSIFGVVYFYSLEMPAKYDEATIIKEAEKLGMIKPSSLLIKDKAETKETTKPTPQTASPTPIPTPSLGPEVVIVVAQGDTAVAVAKKMANKGLITDQEAFVKQMIESKAAYNMFAREYRFNIGMDHNAIITKLITR